MVVECANSYLLDDGGDASNGEDSAPKERMWLVLTKAKLYEFRGDVQEVLGR